MIETYQRPIDIERHPVVEQKYIVPTPSINAMFERVKKLIRLRTPGAIVFAHPRWGKTYAIRYVVFELKQLYPKIVIVSFGCQKKKIPSEDAFFSNLLLAAGHEGHKLGSATRKRSRLNERIEEMVERSNQNLVVFFADEAQRLDIIEYEWLRDVHDELERNGIRMITLLIGQPGLLNQKSAFRLSRQTQIVSRFMIDELRFQGLCSVEDAATCLAGYDTALYPDGTSWTYTRFFYPSAWADGMRLVNEATALWGAFLEAHKAARFKHELEVPMQYFARSVEIALRENMEKDAYDFRFSPAIWSAAVADANFIASQEELRLVMDDESV
jgi:hypothetical protein